MSTLEFSKDEIATIREFLIQRYRCDVEIHLADSELDLQGDGKVSAHPTVYWNQRGAHFVVFKLAANKYRTQFFYTPDDQYSTGIDNYDDLQTCVAAALKTQADHERSRNQGQPNDDD